MSTCAAVFQVRFTVILLVGKLIFGKLMVVVVFKCKWPSGTWDWSGVSCENHWTIKVVYWRAGSESSGSPTGAGVPAVAFSGSSSNRFIGTSTGTLAGSSVVTPRPM